MRTRFANGHVVTPGGVLDGSEIIIDADGIVAQVSPLRDDDGSIDLEGGWLLPGFIDTQVNGGGGVLFNDAMSIDAIAAIGHAHRRFGTTAFLPTLVSDHESQIGAALDAIDAAIVAGVPGVVGIHVEGPFINAARRGIHRAANIRSLDDEAIDLLIKPRAGKVMVTLAPEECEAGVIEILSRHGVIVSVGHSDASYEQVKAAIAAGASGITHLFNAMSPLKHRSPGVVGAALDSPEVWVGLIVDNVHLHPAAVRIALTMKSIGKTMLVTDAMPGVGTDMTSFDLQGEIIRIQDDICVGPDGTLAGSNLDMAAAFRNIAAISGLPPEKIAPMAAGNAAAFLGISGRHGTIAAGQRADWVWLDRNLMPRGTWIAGTEPTMIKAGRSTAAIPS